MNNLFIMLQAAGGEGGSMMNIMMIVLLIAIFYFFMIRPQQKKQKEIKKFRESLTVGDKVVTAGGIYGKIKKVNQTTFVVEITSGVAITVDRGSVYPSAQDVLTDGDAKVEK